MARIASNTEAAVNNNQTAIQGLSSPLHVISQAIPLIQGRTEDTAITVRTMHNDAHASRQDDREFRVKVLQGLTNLVNCVEGSSMSLETAIATTLERHSAERKHLEHDMHFAHSQQTGQMVAKLEAMVGFVLRNNDIALNITRIKASKVFKLV